jgi:phytoene synthase
MAQTKQTNEPRLWSQADWLRIDAQTRARALAAVGEEEAWEIIVKQARAVLRTYSTSFFIVTRFLPPAKRAQVEAIYAAVRYPDEIVDTFPLTPPQRTLLLEQWAEQYEAALRLKSLKQMLDNNVPVFVAGFARVVQETGIPPEYYRAFLEAMRLDVWPRRFMTLDDLIDAYIYGSAIVVGYFLTYVYGENRPGDFAQALCSARDLGIALQLTNFLRDVAEDQRRGRVYLPQDMLCYEGIAELDATDARQQPALNRVLRRLTALTEDYYDRSLAGLDAFAPDSQIAIRACIDVYSQLNRRIAESPRGILHRESVPARAKFKVLPVSKYWRLPLAYLRS